MREDSPPPFIVIRTPPPQARSAYDHSLALVEVVQRLIDHSKARFHLKDRLDRAVTALVLELAKTRHLPVRQHWRHHRVAQQHANDCATILDILAHQRAAERDDLALARDRIEDVLAALCTLG